MWSSGFARHYGFKLTDIYKLDRFGKIIAGFGSMVAVYLFFLASGFTMYMTIRKYSKSEFLINRVFRIFPSLFATILLYQTAALIYSNASIGAVKVEYLTWQRILLDTLLIRDFFPVSWSFLGVLWTLEIEWKFYVFIAFTANLFRLRPSLVMVYSGFVSLMLIIGHQYAVNSHGMPRAEFPADMARWFVFETPSPIYYLTSLPARFWYFGFMLIGSLFAMLALNEISSRKFKLLLIITTIVLFPGKAIVASVLLFWLLYKCDDLLVANKMVRFFSDISYPLYLIHPVSYFLLSAIGLKMGIPGWGLFVICMIFSVTTSWIVHAIVENPFIKVGKWVVSKRTV